MSATFTAAELAKCAEREVRQRIAVYERRVLSGRMTRAQADRETAMMQQIALEYAAKAAANPQASGRLL